MDLKKLNTETQNINSMEIDQCDTLGIINMINTEDKKVAAAVGTQLQSIADAVEAITKVLKNGGRMIYLGAGTSGRLGILDASECPPTYNTNPEQVVGLIAGGKKAVFRSVEHAEDSKVQGINDLQEIDFSTNDILVGIAASGRTPYVLGGLELANAIGAVSIGISCSENSPVSIISQIAITPIVGSEVITGSTRMKAGTAQKMVLNMLSTGAMIKLGKVYKNLMVDVRPTNDKLKQRQIHIVMTATGCNEQTAIEKLQAAHNKTKTAIVMLLLGIDAQSASMLLNENDGYIRQAINAKMHP